MPRAIDLRERMATIARNQSGGSPWICSSKARPHSSPAPASASAAASRWRWRARARALALVARRGELLEEVAGEIVAAGGAKPVLIVEDLLKEGAPDRIAKAALDGLGSVDILVNNAGGSRPFKLDATEEQWQEAMTLNFTRQRQLTHRLLDQMIAGKWGRIVNITGKSEPDGINGAFCAKAGDARLGQGPVARGRQARHHRQLDPAGPHHVRADPPQLHARVPAMAGRQRDPGRPLRRAGGRGQPGVLPGLAAGAATSPARSFPSTAACGATSSELLRAGLPSTSMDIRSRFLDLAGTRAPTPAGVMCVAASHMLKAAPAAFRSWDSCPSRPVLVYSSDAPGPRAGRWPLARGRRRRRSDERDRSRLGAGAGAIAGAPPAAPAAGRAVGELGLEGPLGKGSRQWRGRRVVRGVARRRRCGGARRQAPPLQGRNSSAPAQCRQTQAPGRE